MKLDNNDREIVELLQKDATLSAIAARLNLPESEVETRISRLSDTRTKILIVDDELDTLLALKRALELEDFYVIEAQDGIEALEKVKAEIPDLVLLDLMLPRLNGFEVCQQLKQVEATSSIPIIMLTAKSECSDKVEGIEIGADDYVTKPFDIEELKARIKAVLRRTTP
ncbi:two-component system, OmpR family, alkaline phosphatase synthesis response regulator PhoP [Methanophagales archaeon]|nr:two-component system, OmpR family, alkaline phosphatase synthesis response regulator PhoP [Methanophagales archaeon]